MDAVGNRGQRIAISGKMGSGKSTTAHLLSAQYGLPVLSFASGFKSLVESAGVTKESDEALYRRLCQNIGAGMRAINSDIWVRAFWRRFVEMDTGPWSGCIVDDLRYPNEFDALRDGEFFLVRLEVPGEIRATRRTLIDHESETALDDYADDGRFDFTYFVHGEDPQTVKANVMARYEAWMASR